MTQEQPNTEATASEQSQTTNAENSDAQAAAQEAEIDWELVQKAIDKASPEQIRQMRRFQGIVGSAIQQSRQAWEREQKDLTERQAKERAEQELLEMAQTRPVDFAEKFISDKEAERVRGQLESLKADTAKQYMRQIGQAFGQEFQLTGEEIEQISAALAGKSDEEVLPSFNVAAAKVVTQREAKKMFEEWRQKELPKERDALKQEIAAEMLQGDSAPKVTRSRAPSVLKPQQLPDDKFDEWYEKNVLRRR